MILLESNQNHATAKDTEICTTLSASMGMGGGYVPMITDTLVFDESQITSPVNGNRPKWGDPTHTLSREAGRCVLITKETDMSYQETTGSLMDSGYQKLGTQEAMNDMSVTESCCWDGSQTAPTLTRKNAGGDQRMPDKGNFNAIIEPGTVYGLDRAAYNQGKNAQYDFSVEEEMIGAQVAKGPGAVVTSVVRRLTPEECERLQGFPINWTLIGKPEEVEVKDYKTEWIPGSACKYETVEEARQEYLEAFLDDELDEEDYDAFDPKKYGFVEKRTQIGSHTEIQYFYTDRDGRRKRCADSSRYKAIGNSIAVGFANNQSGFWMWLMKRISAQYERSATLGSLFDGIGGFPLAWEYYNGKGSAVWGSEIESFCIEVTRRRFPDPNDIPED